MSKFKGFTDSETFTQLPDTFFHQLLNQIDDIAELKVTSYLLWRAEHTEGPFRVLSKMDFDVKALGLPAESPRRRGNSRAPPPSRRYREEARWRP